ncbi:MAG TPA: lasso peptide biosynthesis PqqD family chaperone [Bacteroidales bacterium]|nr:lasso peptide biosynthesis PqqD family chaperone [Bacteroidales bacterium]
MKIILESIIKRSSGLVSTDVDGEKVMMSVENGEYFGLDSVGSRIWEMIENPVKVETLIDYLIDEFDVSKQQCEIDTLEFLNELLEKKLLIVVEH